MTTKTEDEIAREKEAVQKMVGAKSAMEAAISRIDRLQKAISKAEIILADLQKHIGDGIYVKTYHYDGGNGGSEAASKVKDQIAYARRILDAVK